MPTNRNENIEFIPYRKEGNNPEYDDLVDHAYRMQATLTIQRRWKNQKPINRKKSINLRESIHFFISEPKNDDYLRYAEKIKCGNYHELNFNDPRFIRHIFKALRLNKINLNQMLMAHSLYDAKQWFHDYDYEQPQLRPYLLFDLNSPFKLAQQIPFAKADDLEAIKQTLSEEDQKYYLMNLSRDAEKIFLSVFFDDQFSFLREKFLGKEIEAFEKRHDKTVHYDLNSLPYSSMYFFVSGLMIVTPHTLIKIIVSPDYDANNSNTPLLSLALFSIETQNQIQLAMHKEEAMLIKPIAGPFDPRLIRAMAEDKTAHPAIAETLSALYPFFEKGSHRFRPAEITHPDIVPAEKIHNGYVNHFVLTWHDFFHAWICSFQTKFFIQHLINVFTQKGVCDSKPNMMNKTIWYLTDMVITDNEDHINSHNVNKIFVSNFLSWIKKNTHNETTFSLLFIDIIKNPDAWDKFAMLNGKHDFFELMESFELDSMELHDYLLNPEFEEIMLDYPHEPNESLILRFLTIESEHSKLFCDAMMAIGHQHIFCWDQKTNRLMLKDEVTEKIKDRYYQDGPKRTFAEIVNYIKPILITVGTQPAFFDVAKEYLAKIIESDYDFWKVALHLTEEQVASLLNEEAITAENACVFLQSRGSRQTKFLSDKLTLFNHPKLITSVEMSAGYSLRL